MKHYVVNHIACADRMPIVRTTFKANNLDVISTRDKN